MTDPPWPKHIQAELNHLKSQDQADLRKAKRNKEFAVETKSQEANFTPAEIARAKRDTINYHSQDGCYHDHVEPYMQKTYLQFLTQPETKPDWLKG